MKPAVEALIFASDSPITESRIHSVIEELSPSQVQRVIEELNQEYEQQNHAFRIQRIAGGFQFVTRPEYAHYIKKYYKGRSRGRLSKAALETLAIIAFKQPISRPEIDLIRGVNSDGVVRTLLERNLIQISGRAETVGHALLYTTTHEFLQHFGINDISELPKPKEIEELLGSAQEELPLELPESEEIDEKITEQMSILDGEEEPDDQEEQPESSGESDEKETE
ncbi:SMC-Scp complex subunit ScpB [candidate division KSB1 bacterium 4484_87]|nr:MAG: SMC-Scp complex subunit ScpB [candidate division KSB1 bacterium 4484_87]